MCTNMHTKNIAKTHVGEHYFFPAKATLKIDTVGSLFYIYVQMPKNSHRFTYVPRIRALLYRNKAPTINSNLKQKI